MGVKRLIVEEFSKRLFKKKAIIILGPRQVGKTYLLKQFVKNRPDILWLNADEARVVSLFDNLSVLSFKNIIGKKRILVIDEAQRITDIGLKLKIIVDNFPDIQVFATGSSSFDLANKINEPLTGRKWEYRLFPLSFEEMAKYNGLFDEMEMLEQRLIYGYYPDVVLNPDDKIEILNLIIESYLYRDVFTWNKIKKSDKLVRLLQALAFQVGSQVNYNELSSIVGIDNKTVESYITLLEQSFVVFRLRSLSRNLRNELKNSQKIYFYDNGVRNALISNYNSLNLRNDTGALWENFLVSERMKYTSYHKIYHNAFFWRNQAQQEIDYIEERDGVIHAYEFKWNPNKSHRFSKSFLKAYPENKTRVVNRDNYIDFVSDFII